MAKPSQKSSSLFKKPSLSFDSAFVRLRDGLHVKILRRCRPILLKDLDPADLLERLSGDDGIRPDVRDSILASKNREERASSFLDRLERADEYTFHVFVDALRDRYRHLHLLLEEMIRSGNGSDDEENVRERKSIAGDALRKLLKDSASRRRVVAGGSDSRSDHSLLEEEDARAEVDRDGKDEEYLDCYVVSTRGKLQRESWIKHACCRKDENAMVEPNSGKTYMAVLTKDLVFRLSDRTALPDLVKQPPKHCTQVYVIDEDSKYTPASVGSTYSRIPGKNGLDLSFRSKRSHTSKAKYPLAGTDSTRRRNKDGPLESTNIGSFPAKADPVPPPLPPKPDNLPLLGLIQLDKKSNERDGADEEPLVVDKVQSDSEYQEQQYQHHHQQQPMPLRADEAPPPLPLRVKKSSGFRQRRQSAENCPVNRDEFVDDADSPPTATGPERDVGEEEADDVSLNFNIEPEDEEDAVQRPENEEEDPYEAINHPDDAGGRKPVSSEETVNSAPLKSDSAKGHDPAEVETDTDTVCSNVTLMGDWSRQNNRTPTVPTPKQPETAEPPEAPTDTTTTLHGRVSPETFPGKVNARDSGVDSVVSQGFPDSPFGADAADPDVFSSCNLDDLKVMLTDDERSSTGYSNYEDIDLMNVRHSPSLYLNPSQSMTHRRSAIRSPYGRTAADHPFSSANQKVLSGGSLLIVETEDVCLFSGLLDGWSSGPTENTRLSGFKGTVLGYDKDGLAYYVPADALKRFGNPTEEDWYYPIELTSREATLFLKRENQMGCFVVYKPRNPSPGVLYNLSVCRGFGGEVVHYHIVENVRGDVMIEGHDHSFLSVGELVSYFRRNQSRLATRLRRSLRDARLPITPGYHYPERFEIPRREIQLNSTVLGQDKFGILCRGHYNGIPVSVKIFQTNEGVIDDDNFLEEAQLHMSLKHENVVRLFGVCCRTKPFYLVTELAEKGTLAECLQNGSIRSDCVEDLFDVCMQTVAAMAYLEGRRYVLHRALSAKNVFVTNDMLVKLANFDRARFVHDDNYLACSSEEVPVRWAAPEVLVGSCYSTKSDVWALGVLFWEVFSGSARPYQKLTDEEVAVFVMEGGRPDRPSGCTRDLFALMKRCWKPLAWDRPSFSAIYEKLKGNSSIYYTAISSSTSQTTSAAQGSLRSSNVPLLPTKVKGSSAPSKASTPSMTSKWRHPSSGRESTRSTDGVLKMILENGKQSAAKPDRQRATMAERSLPSIQQTTVAVDRPLTSSSDSSSIVSASVCNDFDKEDLTRGDKIRKSIRKLITGKKTAK